MLNKAKLLRERLKSGPIVRVMGAHNGLGAKLIERYSYDAIWASGLEISTSHALPDANILTMTENLEAAQAIHEASALPVVCDCDTGYGNAANVKHMVRKYEAAGLAALVIEDKQFPKVNSFVAGRQDLTPIDEFCGKIRAGKEAQTGPALMLVARVEALIAGFGMEEALKRANAYADAGADAIVIHSKSTSPDEIFEFAKRWKRPVPLIAIPTTYNQVTAQQLEQAGFRMVIYANHGLRAAIHAMDSVFKTIDEAGTTAPVENQIASMKEVFELQGMSLMKEDEQKFSDKESVQAIIPAARDHQFQPDLQQLLADKPLCMLKLGEKTLLDRQVDAFHSVSISDIYVVGGHRHEQLKAGGIQVLSNPDYQTSGCAQSILFAKPKIKGSTVVLYSDIVFDREILGRLLQSPYPITLVIDRYYQSLPAREKALDLVSTVGSSDSKTGRNLRVEPYKAIKSIGQSAKSSSSHEFIGMAFLRKEGWAALTQAWEKAILEFDGKRFYGADSVQKADLTDLLAYLIDDGFPIFGLEIEQGWSEIHSRDDYERVLAHFQKPVLTTS